MNNREKEIIGLAKDYAKELLDGDSGGHDFWHTIRVYNLAETIAENEDCNIFLVELGSLLHDVDDPKIFGGVKGEFPNAIKFMAEQGMDKETVDRVCQIIDDTYYRKDKGEIDTVEGKIVWDADCLDMIGAIGIARTFAFGGSQGRAIYNPDISPGDDVIEDLKSDRASTINYFYERLLKVKNDMQTATAKKIAKQRHEFIELYLQEFLSEWDGTK